MFHNVRDNSFQEDVSVHDPQVGGHVSVALSDIWFWLEKLDRHLHI